MDESMRVPAWKAALTAAKIASEGAFQIGETDFFNLCEEQWKRLSLNGIDENTGRLLPLADGPLASIVRRLLAFFAALSREPEQESRFNELMAELDRCQNTDDYEDFKISLNIFLNFFQRTLQQMDQDHDNLQLLLKDFAVSIQTLHSTGRLFLQILGEFERDLQSVDNTRRLDVMFSGLLSHAASLRSQSEAWQDRLFDLNHQVFKLQEKLLNNQEDRPATQTGQLLDSHTFRQKFRYVLQSTRFQRENVSLVYLHLANGGEVEEQAGASSFRTALKHVAATCIRFLRKNDLLCRYDRDTFALLFLNMSLQEAREMGEDLLAAVDSLRFRCRQSSFRFNASLGISVCGIYDTMEVMFRKAQLAVEIAESGSGSPLATEKDIPPDLLDALYIS